MTTLLLFVLAATVSGCVDNCMSYGATITDVYPYFNYNFFYIPIDTASGCKQCYFSINSTLSNVYNIGLYNFRHNNMTYATNGDLNGNIGFTSCNPGYCMISFKNIGLFDSLSIQVIDTPNASSDCFYNNSHCSDEGVIVTQVQYSTVYPSYYKMMGCIFS